MLLELTVKDVALIKTVHLEFGSGLNILTGETGAGKSIVIGSAMLALGAKAKGDMVRKGAEYAYVELVFDTDSILRSRLRESGISCTEDGLIVISRKITPQRSIAKINDETVPLSKLSEVSNLLIDIYGQDESRILLSKNAHLDLLDAFASAALAVHKAGTAECSRRLSQAVKELESFRLDEKQRLRGIEQARYEIQEIDAAALKEGEEEELAARLKKLASARNILEHLETADLVLRDLRIDDAVSQISQALKYDESLRSIYSQLCDASSILSDARTDISQYASDLYADPSEFSSIEKRLDQIRSVESRYGSDVKEVAAYRIQQEERLEFLEQYEQNRLKAEKAVQAAEQELLAACRELSEKRKAIAVPFEKAVAFILKDLGFRHAGFHVNFTGKTPGSDGMDEVMFMASLNEGEDEKPVMQTASGGELSRIMLAIKTVLAEKDSVPTIIFDEVDTGISGRTAQRVAEKLDVIAGNRQVICITHLPQIASMADNHYLIEKVVSGNRSETRIQKLSEEETVRELGRMLSGSELTDAVLENASEMRSLALEKKLKTREKNTYV